jgi:transposase
VPLPPAPVLPLAALGRTDEAITWYERLTPLDHWHPPLFLALVVPALRCLAAIRIGRLPDVAALADRLTAHRGRHIDATDVEAQPLKKELQRFGARQPACRALADAQYGIGGLIAVAVWSELGDCRRFSRSEQAVRHTGLDVSVDSSDRRRAGGFSSRKGPQTLRWALYEAAKNSSHLRSPDHDFYAAVKAATTARSPPSR